MLLLLLWRPWPAVKMRAGPTMRRETGGRRTQKHTWRGLCKKKKSGSVHWGCPPPSHLLVPSKKLFSSLSFCGLVGGWGLVLKGIIKMIQSSSSSNLLRVVCGSASLEERLAARTWRVSRDGADTKREERGTNIEREESKAFGDVLYRSESIETCRHEWARQRDAFFVSADSKVRKGSHDETPSAV